jgi:hypothetical protein
MTDTKDEALKLALEALENGKRVRNAEGGTKYQPDLEDKAIAACEQALGAPVPQGSIQHLKTMMEESAWEGRLELSDALANIDEFYAPPAAPVQPAVPLEDQRKLPENAARLIIEAWIKETYGSGYSYNLSEQDEGTSWAWWIDSHPFEDPDAATGFDGGTSWIDFDGRITDCSSIPDEFNALLQTTPPAAPVQQKPLFAGIIAKHPGLAEELKAMDAEPEKGGA